MFGLGLTPEKEVTIEIVNQKLTIIYLEWFHRCMNGLLSGDAHARRPLHKIHCVLFCFVFFVF